MYEVRHRTNDYQGQTNGRPLTIDNDRADAMGRAWWTNGYRRPGPRDADAFRLADLDPWDPLFDPMEQRGDPTGFSS